ncbi:MAG: hypothetical protein KME46_19215 [Brasilonema angustatum HA4187-MV1]|jgi:hypothetical protein|nr:hypothetical protein [Brasilonema angustatum HA4187-MV1]
MNRQDEPALQEGFQRQIPLSGNPPMALCATLRASVLAPPIVVQIDEKRCKLNFNLRLIFGKLTGLN